MSTGQIGARTDYGSEGSSAREVRKRKVAPLASRVTSGATTKECPTEDALPSESRKIIWID